MDVLDNLSKHEIREFFSRGWITHDAMWYLHCVNSFGVEKTNEINKSAVKSMAEIEIKRIRKILGYDFEKVENWEQMKKIIIEIFSLVKADFMDLSIEFSEENVFRGGMKSCFAYEGITKMGLADKYSCGIFVRLLSWFDGLGVKYKMDPDFQGCLMHQKGKCSIDFRFYF